MTSRETDAAWNRTNSEGNIMTPTELADRIASGEKWAVGIHSCGYHCEIPACMKAQRLELLARLDAAELDSKLLDWLGREIDCAIWLTGDRHLYIDSENENDLRAVLTAAMKGKP